MPTIATRAGEEWFVSEGISIRLLSKNLSTENAGAAGGFGDRDVCRNADTSDNDSRRRHADRSFRRRRTFCRNCREQETCEEALCLYFSSRQPLADQRSSWAMAVALFFRFSMGRIFFRKRSDFGVTSTNSS